MLWKREDQKEETLRSNGWKEGKVRGVVVGLRKEQEEEEKVEG